MAIGAVWMTMIMICVRSLSLISMVILARLLTPEDFGLIALASAIIAGLELMSAFGFDVVLIQNQEASREHYDTAWTIQIIFAIAIALILTGLAAPAADFYDDPRLANIIYVLAIGVVAAGFQNIGIVAFRKDLEFHKEFMFLVTKKLIGFTVAISLAFYLRSYWALIIAMVVSKFSGLVLSYITHPYRPRLSTSALAQLFGFSRWLFINNILAFVKWRASDFIIGKVVGPSGLGMFSISLELATMPANQLAAPINRAVFPGYAKMADDLSRLSQSYLDVMQVIAMIVIPSAFGIAVLAAPIVTVVLGEQWIDAIPLIRILGFVGLLSALESNIASVYLTLGKPQILTRLLCINVPILLVFLIIGARQGGVMGAAWAFLAASIITIPLWYTVVFRTLDIAILKFLAIIWRPFASALVMLAVLLWLMSLLSDMTIDIGTPLALLTLIMTGVIVYVITMAVMWLLSGQPRGAEQMVWARFNNFVLSWFKRSAGQS
jgi:O-antigen/teichoic acid export membrane protein